MRNDQDGRQSGKLAAAQYALGFIRSGMRVGLGTGTTADLFIDMLAAAARNDGLRIQAAATSVRTAKRARAAGLEVSDLNRLDPLDITVDGADEIDPALNLIKGGGGALLQEKIVAAASKRLVIIADDSKQVDCLGGILLPVEVVRFGWASTAGKLDRELERCGYRNFTREVRKENGAPFLTEEGHRIIDYSLAAIAEPGQLERSLTMIPGVVETGLFVGLCSLAVIGQADGDVLVRTVQD